MDSAEAGVQFFLIHLRACLSFQDGVTMVTVLGKRRPFMLLTCASIAMMGGAACFAAAPARTAAAIKTVTVIADPRGLGVSGTYGVRKLEDALHQTHFRFSRSGTGGSCRPCIDCWDWKRGRPGRTSSLASMKVTAPEGSEALTVRTGAKYQNKPAIVLAGSDDTGLMYGALDVADRMSWSDGDANPFQYVGDISETPFLRERGVVMFAMNRAYFERSPLRRTVLGTRILT